ncbi:DegT/DnrJ/EryC1/StrS family aminotransferase [bacterium]|nr:DegT/DnrJ/EryC1/StrS family aminotransferase [bacterium]
MGVPLLDLAAQYKEIGDELNSAVLGILESGMFILGPAVAEFEKNAAEYCGTKYSIGVASGTDALVISLLACGIGKGDEVITTPFTFFASAEAISNIGAIPVFADIKPDTFNIDPVEIEKKVTSKTRGIMPVHLYGQCADNDAIKAIADKHNLMIVEDACQAIGSKYRRVKAGALGNAGAFSFFPTKNLGGAGDGGLITTNDEKICELSKKLRVHGSSKRYYHDTLGYNSRLDALQAAVLNVKLKYLDSWNENRRKNAAYYNQLLAGVEGVETPIETADRYHIYHQYTIRVKGKRNDVQAAFAENKIGHSIYYPLPIHLQTPYAYMGFGKGSFPVTEKAADEVISLPIYPELTESQMDEVVEVIKKVVG